MNRATLMRFAPAASFFVGAALMFSTRTQTAVPLAGSLETVLPSYQGLRVTTGKVSDEERRVAGMSDYLYRIFWRDSLVAFTTYVGYYDRQTQGKTMHSPRNCMPGAGWEILRADTGSVMALGQRHVVNKYLLKNGNVQALVLYWYQGRGRVVANEYAVKWNLLRDAAVEGHTEEALVRIVVPVSRGPVADDAALEPAYRAAYRIAEDAGAQLLTDVNRVLPVRGAAKAQASAAAVRERTRLASN